MVEPHRIGGRYEIGELLGVTESRVCQLHSRAVARLRAALEEREEEH